MASAKHCALLLFLLVAGLCDATDNYNILDFEMARKHELWMAKYGRVYKDEAEKAKRFEIFKKNVQYIEDFNSAGEHKYTLGVNLFTDLTDDEFLTTYTGGVRVPDMESVEYSTAYETIDELDAPPTTVDWRTKGAVSPVKFQDGCGSCWSFATVATVESLTQITKGVLYNLSAQQLIDCDVNNGACVHGWTGRAYEYIVKHRGLTTEENYPFKGANGTCNRKKASQAVADIGGYKYVNRNSEPSLMKAVAKQPVAVLIDASKELQHYKSGVFHGPCTNTTNHAVVAVGYGEADDSTKYWIIKNSWGDWWGEDGYLRMQKDVAAPEGLCGIAMWANYPTA